MANCHRVKGMTPTTKMTTNLMTNEDIDYDRLRDANRTDEQKTTTTRLSPTVRDLPSVLGDGRALIMSDYTR